MVATNQEEVEDPESKDAEGAGASAGVEESKATLPPTDGASVAGNSTRDGDSADGDGADDGVNVVVVGVDGTPSTNPLASPHRSQDNDDAMPNVSEGDSAVSEQGGGLQSETALLEADGGQSDVEAAAQVDSEAPAASDNDGTAEGNNDPNTSESEQQQQQQPLLDTSSPDNTNMERPDDPSKQENAVTQSAEDDDATPPAGDNDTLEKIDMPGSASEHEPESTPGDGTSTVDAAAQQQSPRGSGDGDGDGATNGAKPSETHAESTAFFGTAKPSRSAPQSDNTVADAETKATDAAEAAALAAKVAAIKAEDLSPEEKEKRIQELRGTKAMDMVVGAFEDAGVRGRKRKAMVPGWESEKVDPETWSSGFNYGKNGHGFELRVLMAELGHPTEHAGGVTDHYVETYEFKKEFGGPALYKGWWLDGQPHGRGKAMYKRGNAQGLFLSNGDWSHGQWHGYMVLKWRNGNIFQGHIRHNVISGEGHMTNVRARICVLGSHLATFVVWLLRLCCGFSSLSGRTHPCLDVLIHVWTCFCAQRVDDMELDNLHSQMDADYTIKALADSRDDGEGKSAAAALFDNLDLPTGAIHAARRKSSLIREARKRIRESAEEFKALQEKRESTSAVSHQVCAGVSWHLTLNHALHSTRCHRTRRAA